MLFFFDGSMPRLKAMDQGRDSRRWLNAEAQGDGLNNGNNINFLFSINL